MRYYSYSIYDILIHCYDNIEISYSHKYSITMDKIKKQLRQTKFIKDNDYKYIAISLCFNRDYRSDCYKTILLENIFNSCTFNEKNRRLLDIDYVLRKIEQNILNINKLVSITIFYEQPESIELGILNKMIEKENTQHTHEQNEIHCINT